MNLSQNIFNSFIDFSQKKNIQFTLTSSGSFENTYFDPDKVEKILVNLLSNAFKFTPIGGTIMVELEHDKLQQGWVNIIVSDDGIGIAAENHSKIFNRFFQIESDGNSPVEGTGIGLNITKDMVELHHGRIQVKSEYGKGSSFSIFLPVLRNYFTDVELKFQANEHTFKHINEENYISQNTEVKNEVQSESDKDFDQTRLLLLFVDDNLDLREFIQQNMGIKYRVITSSNGKDAFELAINELPHIIISDIMMPGMDGFELCSKLKNNFTTNHIPVILLTAKVDETNQENGYNIGADDYIPKPFSLKILEARINNIIKNHELLKIKYQRIISAEPQKLIPANTDEQFLLRIIQIIESHLEDFDFGIDELAKELVMSKSQLYRKFNYITDVSIGEYIKSYKLKKASQYLQNTTLNINEISFKTGFVNSTYFIKCFKQEFQITPKEFQKRHKK
ncbi:MAG: response regulator [Bacteroidales bacterium]|nr:response regulator [Bacteroidales bacterium]